LIVDTLSKFVQICEQKFQKLKQFGVLKTKMPNIPENNLSEKSGQKVLQCKS